jgi:hypothetical protein
MAYHQYTNWSEPVGPAFGGTRVVSSTRPSAALSAGVLCRGLAGCAARR